MGEQVVVSVDRAANGDDPTECPGDSREHGDPRESGHSLDCEDGCSRCDPRL